MKNLPDKIQTNETGRYYRFHSIRDIKIRHRCMPKISNFKKIFDNKYRFRRTTNMFVLSPDKRGGLMDQINRAYLL